MITGPFDGATNLSVDENCHNDDVSYQVIPGYVSRVFLSARCHVITQWICRVRIKRWCLSSLRPNKPTVQPAFDIDWHNFDIGCFSAKRAGRKRLQSLGIQCLCLECFNEAGTPNNTLHYTSESLSQHWKLAEHLFVQRFIEMGFSARLEGKTTGGKQSHRSSRVFMASSRNRLG